jgi:hypothetical protein
MAPLTITFIGSQFAVPSGSTPTGLSIANGDVAIAWQDGSNPAVQLFNSSGVAISSETLPAVSGGADFNWKLAFSHEN